MLRWSSRANGLFVVEYIVFDRPSSLLLIGNLFLWRPVIGRLWLPSCWNPFLRFSGPCLFALQQSQLIIVINTIAVRSHCPRLGCFVLGRLESFRSRPLHAGHRVNRLGVNPDPLTLAHAKHCVTSSLSTVGTAGSRGSWWPPSSSPWGPAPARIASSP